MRYSYLWRREFDHGREEGAKDRPGTIVLSVLDTDGEQEEILVLPITRSLPADPADAMEISAVTKEHLGLDIERSWIILSEANEFLWPSLNLRPLPGRTLSSVAYGVLPPRFFAHVRDRFLARYQRKKAACLQRSE